MAENKRKKRARDRTRRKLKKKGGRKFVIRPSSGDLVGIQISTIFDKPIKGAIVTRALVEEMILHKANTSEGYWDGTRVVGAKEGENPKGVRIVILRWKNPGRDIASDRGWRYADPDSPADQADAWGSLRRIITRASLSVKLDRHR